MRRPGRLGPGMHEITTAPLGSVIRVASVTAVAVAVVIAACSSGGYKDHCPASVGTPGTVQCVNEVCDLHDSGSCCAFQDTDAGVPEVVTKGGYLFRSLECDDATSCESRHDNWNCVDEVCVH